MCIKNIFLIILCISTICKASFASEQPSKEWSSQEYKVILQEKTHSDEDDITIITQLLTVKKSNKVIYENSYESMSSYAGMSLRNADKNPLEDITGDGIPDLVIDEYSGGAHCCYLTTLLELGETAHSISLGGGDWVAKFEDLDHKPGKEAIVSDGAFKYRWSDYASSPGAQVILRHDNGSYIMAPDIMKQPPYTEKQINKIISVIKNSNYSNFRYATNLNTADSTSAKALSNYFTNMLSKVLELIYSGNYFQALQIVDATWPGNKNEKEAFLKDLKETIQKQQYGKDILSMNGLVKETK